MLPRVKLTVVKDGTDVPVEWPDHWQALDSQGVRRLVVATRQDTIELMGALASFLRGPYYILFVLHYPRGDIVPARYESPSISLAECRAFLDDHAAFLRADGFSALWVGAQDRSGLVVLDEHGLIYAYGPLVEMQRELEQRGIVDGECQIPSPHMHPFESSHEADVRRLMRQWAWRQHSLMPDDA